MKYILKNYQSPGDIVMLTAAVRDLKLSHPEIEIDVDTAGPELWENNPHITKGLDGKIIKADYPLIHDSMRVSIISSTRSGSFWKRSWTSG